MKKYLKYLVVLVLVSTLSLLSLGTTTLQAHAFTSSDADTAINSYISSFYDSDAKYFYADTTQSNLNDFWKEAISWDIIMDAYQRTNSPTYRQLIDDVYDGFMAQNSDMSTACNTDNSFTLNDNYNDDIGWWAKASIRAYQITGEQRYEHCAQRLFDSIYSYWDTSTLNGGIWWTRNNPTQKNIATNAPAVITAAGLSQALSDSSYLDKAEQIYNWTKATFTDSQGDINDDYDTSTGSFNDAQYSYNYGTMIGAATALYQATNDSSYLSDAQNYATASLTNVATNGILNTEDATSDQGGFRGIYVRYLAQYAQLANQSQFITFLQNNATTAWNNRRSSDNLVGTNWASPTPSGTIDVHTYGSIVALLQDVPPDNASSGQNNTITVQAEDGTLHNLNTESIYSGYYGSGYIAGWNTDGQYVDLTFNAPTSGSYTLTLRYAAGAGDASRYIYVNGSGVVNNLTFPGTGSWTNYATVTVNNVSFNSGNNTVSVIYNRSLGSSNYLNLDQVTATPQ